MDDYGPIPVPGPYVIDSPRTETVTETVTVQHPELLADTGPAPTDFFLPLALIVAGFALVLRSHLRPQH